MGLFGQKWKSTNKKDIDKALSEVAKINDQQKLKQIVLEAHFVSVMEAALDRITDPAVLMDLVMVRRLRIPTEALNRINDQNLLKEIALQETACAPDAVKKISDQEILIEIIGSYAGIDAIKQAIGQIDDLDVLKKAFHDSARPDVQMALWRRFPIADARQIAQEWGIDEKEMCVKIGAHCDAPGPVIKYTEQNFDEGSTDHELIRCELCGKPIYSREKKSSKLYSWGQWYYQKP